MFDHPRSDWLPAGEPFNGPGLNLSIIDSIIIHYIGTAQAPRDSGRWMLNEHRRTMGRENPYAFMYNSHVGLDGETWEGRGVQFRNAANGATNRSTWSIVFAVNGQKEASAAQVAGARRLVSGIRSHVGRPIPLIGHKDIGSTQCPGTGIYEQIRAGVFDGSIQVSRIAGDNRYGTAAAVSQTKFPKGAQVAFVVSGTDYADALAIGPLVGTEGPILLTQRDRLPAETAAELRRLKVKEVVIVGGTAAVSAAVEAEISRLVV